MGPRRAAHRLPRPDPHLLRRLLLSRHRRSAQRSRGLHIRPADAQPAHKHPAALAGPAARRTAPEHRLARPQRARGAVQRPARPPSAELCRGPKRNRTPLRRARRRHLDLPNRSGHDPRPRPILPLHPTPHPLRPLARAGPRTRTPAHRRLGHTRRCRDAANTSLCRAGRPADRALRRRSAASARLPRRPPRGHPNRMERRDQ